MKHFPVMSKEAIFYLNINDGNTIIDGTVGLFGHSKLILEKLRNGKLIGIDRDKNALNYIITSFLKENHIGSRAGEGFLLYSFSCRTNSVSLYHSKFSRIKEISIQENAENVNGILLDLGMSSMQIDDIDRGFSYFNDSKLDMRMDTSLNITAEKIIELYSKEALEKIFRENSEEKYARRIAESIVQSREIEKIDTSKKLSEIIENALPKKEKNFKSVKRIFQALRIEVNDEFSEIEKALKNGFEILGKGGRFVVITFHSLEDAIVKKIFSELVKNGRAKKIVNKPIVPSEDEINENKRSKSAKMRVIEKDE